MYGSVVWLLSGFGVVAALLMSPWLGSLWRALGGRRLTASNNRTRTKTGRVGLWLGVCRDAPGAGSA
ncbi:MAG: hypothetical protein QOI78_9319, partial [Actinomycetota bacterium]|nr:hypothetical protein [Actinomycetota bacterium]